MLQNGNWSNNPDTCNKVIQLAISLVEMSVRARQEAEERDKTVCDQQLSSARLTAQAVIRAAEKQNWPECCKQLKELKTCFDSCTNYMKSLLYIFVSFRVI